MAEDQQVADDQQAEQPPLDYEGMSTEELEKRLRDGEGVITEVEEFPPAPVEPEPEPEADPVVEPEVEVKEDVAGEVQAEEEPAEVEFDEKQSYIDELKLELEKTQGQREKQEMLHGLRAGEVGQLRQQMQQLTQQFQQPPVKQEEAYGEPQQTPQNIPVPSDPVLQTRLAELEDDSRTQGLAAEYNTFVQQHPDAEGMIQEMAPAIQQELEPYKDMQLTGKSVRKVLRMALGTAYAEHKLQEIRTNRQKAIERRASQVPEKKKAKLAASISGSGAAPAPKVQPKRVEDMTAEEADAALIAEYGDGHYRRRRR